MMANQNQQKVPDLVPINGSTNVYVGQRYVPKFYDDGTEQHGATWDKNQTYEPLTIVLWEGDSYTSRTFVPAGVEISNTQYWLPTGIFNAQLAAVQNDVNKMENDIIDMKKKLGKRKYIFIGDSYALGITDGDIVNGWPKCAVSDMALNDDDYYIAALGGSGFTKGENGTVGVNGFMNALNSLDSVITDKEAITDIVIGGGYNDNAANLTAIGTNAYILINNARQKYPRAKFWVFFMAVEFGKKEGGTRERLPNTENSYLSLGGYACYSIQNSLRVNQKILVSADGVHPTQIGYQRLGQAVASVLNGGSIQYGGIENVIQLTDVEGTNKSISVTLNQNWYDVSFNMILSYATPLTVVNQWVKLCSLNSDLINGLGENAQSAKSCFTLHCYTRSSNTGEWEYTPLIACVFERDIYVRNSVYQKTTTIAELQCVQTKDAWNSRFY